MKKEENNIDTKSNFIRGSIELMVLYLLSQKDCYGYELTQTMGAISNGILNIQIGTLYPALYKLMDRGYISDYKKQAGKRLTRVYYHLEPAGEKRLKLITNDYYATNKAIQDVLNYKPDKKDS